MRGGGISASAYIMRGRGRDMSVLGYSVTARDLFLADIASWQ